jgi:hypothetical protein
LTLKSKTIVELVEFYFNKNREAVKREFDGEKLAKKKVFALAKDWTIDDISDLVLSLIGEIEHKENNKSVIRSRPNE